jgi:hypothetical protein
MSVVVHVAFLETSKDERHAVNKLASEFGKMVHGRGIHHVEINIPEPDGSFLSASIHAGETVMLNRVKTFANPGYIVCSKVVSRDELSRIRMHLVSANKNGVGFDGLGMYLAALPFQIKPASSTSTFCSRLVTEALQAGGVECVEGLSPCIVSPSKLFKVMSHPGDHRTVAGSIEYKQRSFFSNARGYELVPQG